MADIKNFGIKGIASDVQMGKSGGRLVYDSGNSRFDITQSNGSTLEDIRFGTVESGTWNGTAVATGYGGTGQDLSSSTGVMLVAGGTVSAGSVALASQVSGQLPVANGGTGAATAGAARTALGLGNISTQASNSVNIDGGAIDGAIIGANSKAAIGGTVITATTNFVGALTGDVTGTADAADAMSSAVTVALSGDATGSSTFTNAGSTCTVAATLAASGVTAASYGSSTAIPVITVDAKGRITTATTAAITTSWTAAGDSGSSTISGGDTFTINGTNNEIETVVSGDAITVGIVTNPTIGGDLTVSGNLTVSGTQTIINSTTTETVDNIFRVNSDGNAQDAGFEANVGSSIKQILYDVSATEWTLGSEDLRAARFYGPITGAVTGDVVGDVTGNADTATVLAASRTITIDGDVDAAATAFNGSQNITLTTTLDNTGVSAASYGSSTAIPVITVDAKGRITAASTAAISSALTIAADSGSNDTVTVGTDTLTFAGTANEIETTVSNNQIQIGLPSTVSGLTSVSATTLTNGTVSIVGGALTGVTTIGASGTITAGAFNDGVATYDAGVISSGVSATFSGAVTGGSLTDGTATLSSGALSAATTGAFSGNVTVGRLKDGTLEIASGNITSADSITASGTIQYGSLSDGSITITAFVDEDNMASNSASLLPTQQSVKAYVDSAVGGADLDFQGDAGGALSIDLDSEVLDIAGGNNITTTGSGNEISVALDATVTGLTSVTSTTITDGTATLTGGALTGVASITTTGDAVIGGNLTVNGATTSVASTNTTVEDTIIVLQSGLSGANPNDIGHIYERGSDGNNGFLGWDQSTDRFIAATTTADGSTAGDLTLAAAGFEAAAFTGTSATISGAVSFGTLTDSGESIAITKFVDEGDGIGSNDNDTSIPTSAAIVDYVENNGGEGLIIRGAFTANSSDSSFAIGTMPNISSRTYYADKIVLKVGTAFSGGSFNHILIKENAGAGNTLVASADADAATAGSYIINLDGDDTLTKNATVLVQFKQSNGSTASVPTAGVITATVHYNYTG